MLNKIKARFAGLKEKLSSSKLQKFGSLCQKSCCYVTDQFGRFVSYLAKFLYKADVSANLISILGFSIGLLAINFLALAEFNTALICILINRFFDALDGALARHSKVTEFGIFLDATLDYVFYAGVIFGFALAEPYQNAVAASFLLFAFTASACAMLAYAIVAYKNNSRQKLSIAKSPFYLGGFAQGFETFIAVIILCLVPSYFLYVAIILGIFCFVKACSVVIAAYYNFVIAQRSAKE